MWKLIKLIPLILLAGCNQNEDMSSTCHGGTILGKIRGGGGGVAISMDDSSFGAHSWHSASNVVEALNVPDSLWVEGMRLYFIARPATETEKSFLISADGDESDKPLIFVTKFSRNDCAGSQ